MTRAVLLHILSGARMKSSCRKTAEPSLCTGMLGARKSRLQQGRQLLSEGWPALSHMQETLMRLSMSSRCWLDQLHHLPQEVVRSIIFPAERSWFQALQELTIFERHCVNRCRSQHDVCPAAGRTDAMSSRPIGLTSSILNTISWEGPSHVTCIEAVHSTETLKGSQDNAFIINSIEESCASHKPPQPWSAQAGHVRGQAKTCPAISQTCHSQAVPGLNRLTLWQAHPRSKDSDWQVTGLAACFVKRSLL